MTTIERRLSNPAELLPGAYQGIARLLGAIGEGGVPTATLELVALRTSQLNGCSACVQSHLEALQADGVPIDKIVGVGAWGESPYFDDAERAALTLADALARLADSHDPVPDELWREVTKHFDERQIAALLLQIGLLNLFNRVNVAVREPADDPSWKRSA